MLVSGLLGVRLVWSRVRYAVKYKILNDESTLCREQRAYRTEAVNRDIYIFITTNQIREMQIVWKIHRG